MTEEVISKSEAIKAVLNSGYLLETRVENVLREFKYSVEPNPTYLDPQTGKHRELDIVATDYDFIHDSEVLDGFGTVLLIECINNKQPLAFIKNASRDNDDIFQALDIKEDIIKAVGRPNKITRSILLKSTEGEEVEGLIDQSLAEFSRWIPSHHYFSNDVYTQYLSFAVKGKSRKEGIIWQANHENAHHDSLNKLCHVVDFESDRFAKKFGSGVSMFFHQYHLVLILQNELWTILQKQDGTLEINDINHLSFLITKVNPEGENYYHIDVMRESNLPTYLELIQQQRNELLEQCQKLSAEIADSLLKVAEQKAQLEVTL